MLVDYFGVSYILIFELNEVVMFFSEFIVVGSRCDFCEGMFVIMLKNKIIRFFVFDR